MTEDSKRPLTHVFHVQTNGNGPIELTDNKNLADLATILSESTAEYYNDSPQIVNAGVTYSKISWLSKTAYDLFIDAQVHWSFLDLHSKDYWRHTLEKEIQEFFTKIDIPLATFMITITEFE